ncbi:MAG: archease [Candidatus Krumholzibacteriales bacterium]
MNTRGHQEIEHTADMGLKGWGPDLESAFEEVASAMFELMADIEGLEEEFTIQASCEADSVDELLVEFLNTVITGLDLEEALGVKAEVERLRNREGTYFLTSVVHCVKRDNAHGRMLQEVKAATSYGADVRNTEQGSWEAVCVVDM